MQKLKAANLYRSELIPVSGKLVERYNQCLTQLGFKKTRLKSFSIDGLGWSPEIAEEKDDLHYLNHGEANQHGIIITPLQKGKPVYVPFHSFDRDMMQLIFKTYPAQIADITKDSAICIDFDQSIDTFYEPLDVLQYDEITISFHLINGLTTAQKEQEKLIAIFNSGNNFIDETIHQQLLESAKVYGDLRNRNLHLESIKFRSDSFYTRAFGGIYVLRDFISPIAVFEDEKAYKEAIKDTFHDILIYHISHPELIAKLRDHVIIEHDLFKEIKTPRYDRIKKYVFSQSLKKVEHPIKDILTNNALFKSYLNKIDMHARKKVMGVERYVEKMQVNNQYKMVDMVDEDIFHALHSPHSSLSPKHQDLIWKLLMNVSPKDVLYLYWYDKEEFYKQFKTWDESLKDWVIETIKQNI